MSIFRTSLENEDSPPEEPLLTKFDKETKITLKIRVFLSLMFALETILTYNVMLLTMTFNGWVIISLLLGMTAGYFLRDINDDFTDCV